MSITNLFTQYILYLTSKNTWRGSVDTYTSCPLLSDYSLLHSVQPGRFFVSPVCCQTGAFIQHFGQGGNGLLLKYECLWSRVQSSVLGIPDRASAPPRLENVGVADTKDHRCEGPQILKDLHRQSPRSHITTHHAGDKKNSPS